MDVFALLVPVPRVRKSDIADKTLKDVAALMAKIDFCMMETRGEVNTSQPVL